MIRTSLSTFHNYLDREKRGEMVRSMLGVLLLAAASVAQDTPNVTFSLHRITSFDGTQLEANSYAPSNISSPLPLVVMINSFGVPGIEYAWPAREMATRGYIAVEYASRGWYTSGGEIDIAGENDQRDHAEVVTWAMQYWGDKLNVSAIATGGVSYGAGISLITAAIDPRIKAVFAFSGWSQLLDALWWNEAPSLYWGLKLAYGVPKIMGNLPPVIGNLVNYTLTYYNMSFVKNYSYSRSPMTYIDQLNDRNVPVLMSNQFEDNLFHSNFQLEYWKKLTGPKKLFLNQGTHAEAEGKGLLPFLQDGPIWGENFLWLDRFLKGIDNGAEKGDLVQVSLSDHHDPLIPGNPVYTHANYSTWPPSKPEEKYTEVRYSLHSRETAQYGTLSTTPPTNATDVISYSNRTEMQVGIPFLKPGLQPVVPKVIDIEKLNPEYELAFLTAPFTEKTRFCGNFNISGLQVVSNAERFQVMGYLWSVKPKNFFGATKAALMTHAPLDVWEGASPGRPYTLPPMTFHTACRDFKKNDMLMLGLSMNNSLYSAANMSAGLSIRLMYNTASLHLSTVAEV